MSRTDSGTSCQVGCLQIAGGFAAAVAAVVLGALALAGVL